MDNSVIFTMQLMIFCNELVFALAMTLYCSFNNNSLQPWSVVHPKQSICQVEISLYGKFLCVGATFLELRERNHFQNFSKLCLQTFSPLNNYCLRTYNTLWTQLFNYKSQLVKEPYHVWDIFSSIIDLISLKIEFQVVLFVFSIYFS